MNEKTYWEQENSNYNDHLDRLPASHSLFTSTETSSHTSLLRDTLRFSVTPDIADSPFVIAKEQIHRWELWEGASAKREVGSIKIHKPHYVSDRATSTLSGKIRKAKQAF